MLRRLSNQSAMNGFEDDEVIRDQRFSRVDNTQTEVPSSGGGSTEGTGRQRDEGRVQWERSATYGKSVREYDRDRAATPRCDTMRVGMNAPEWGKGKGDRERGAAETQTKHTGSADAEVAEGIGRGGNGTGPTTPGGVSEGSMCGREGSTRGREGFRARPESLIPHMAGSCDCTSGRGDGGSTGRGRDAADMALQGGHPIRGGHAERAASLSPRGEHQHACAAGLPPALGSVRSGLQNDLLPEEAGREGRDTILLRSDSAPERGRGDPEQGGSGREGRDAGLDRNTDGIDTGVRGGLAAAEGHDGIPGIRQGKGGGGDQRQDSACPGDSVREERTGTTSSSRGTCGRKQTRATWSSQWHCTARRT